MDANAIYSCTTGIQLCLDTLLQLMDDFVRCYHDEIEPWTKKDTSMLTSLGPLCKRVNCSLLIVIEVLVGKLNYYDYLCLLVLIVVRELLETGSSLFPMEEQTRQQKIYSPKR